MKKYDFKKAKELITRAAGTGQLVDASMGMYEDWFWTGVGVWSEGKFIKSLDEEPELAGLSSSSWATPSLMLLFADGTERIFSCFTGESDKAGPGAGLYGCLSKPVQETLIPLEEDYVIEEALASKNN